MALGLHLKSTRLLWVVSILLLLLSFGLYGCGDGDGETVYCCTYQSRHTGCGGSGWTSWETKYYQFDIDDYLDEWTPERVCNKFTGSDTECGGSCCINIEYRNNVLSNGNCAGESI